MKVILTEKITKLGNIGDAVDVATGYARNYLIPKGRAMRWSKDNLALFETKKADLIAKNESAKKSAEANAKKIEGVKLCLIRSAGDTGHLYGSVSSRDLARLIGELTGVEVASEQVLLGQPIKEIGTWDVKVALHSDVVVEAKAYVAQTRDEIDALIAGKSIKKETKAAPAEPEAEPEAPAAEQPTEQTPQQ
jgi:large subunit ribosomal protein L9